jgi:hypothetical protein
MSALEREIIDKFHQLQPAAKKRVRALIEQDIAAEIEQAHTSAFDYNAWVREVEELRHQLRASQGGESPAVDVVEILRDIREGEDE